MSPILKFTAALFCVLMFNKTLLAQCNVTTSSSNNIEILTVGNDYEYTRINGKYFAIAIKTVLQKNTAGPLYFSTIEYTYDKISGLAEFISFKSNNGLVVSGKLQAISTKKNDDIKSGTIVYKLAFTETDLAALKNHLITKVIFTNKIGTVAIPISNTTFMQTQINCLQASN